MAITRVGASQGMNGTSNGVLSRAAGTTGNLLVVGFELASSGATPTINDTQGNTWNVCNARFPDATNGAVLLSWYAVAKNTTSTTITVSGGVATFASMTLDEFTGQLSGTPLDQTAHSVVGASGTPTSPTITPTQDNELVWSYCSDTVTAVGLIGGTNATKGGDDGSGDWSEFRVLGAGTSGVGITVKFTGSGAYDLLAATFKAPPTGPAGYACWPYTA